MKKDIIIPESKGLNLGIVIVDDQTYDLFLINQNEHSISNIIIVSEAKNETQVSSTLRYFLESCGSQSCIKFETIYGEVTLLDNTISLTYFVGNDIIEKVFEFNIQNDYPFIELPIVNQVGFLI